MNAMFANNGRLNDIDVSHLDTHNVITMGLMFSRDTSLSSLDVSNWDVSNVQRFGATFSNAQSLKSLDLSRWRPLSVNNLGYTFENDYGLYSLDLSNFNTTQNRYMDNMIINSGVRKLTLGQDTYLNQPAGISGYGIWQNPDTQQVINGASLTNDDSHPGTWLWQK